ncbi:MAG: heme exporter protein CcmD [Hyphomonadaceae bacterium]
MLDYGKYTPYVLTSYGIAIAVLLGVLVWSVLRVAASRRKLDAAEAAESKSEEDADA